MGKWMHIFQSMQVFIFLLGKCCSPAVPQPQLASCTKYAEHENRWVGHFKLYVNWKQLKNNVNIGQCYEKRMHSTSTNTNAESKQQVVTAKAIINY